MIRFRRTVSDTVVPIVWCYVRAPQIPHTYRNFPRCRDLTILSIVPPSDCFGTKTRRPSITADTSRYRTCLAQQQLLHHRCLSSSSSSSSRSSSPIPLSSLPPTSIIPPALLTPSSLREQIANAMHQVMLERSPEVKRIKKDELKLRQFEKLQSVAGQQLVNDFEEYKLFENADEANQWAEQMIQSLEAQRKTNNNNQPIYVGIHVGWNLYGKKREKLVTHLFSISFPNQPVICLSLYKMDCYRDETKFPANVRTLLQLPYIKACGVNINRFLARIKRYLHIIIPIRIELEKLAMIMEPRTIKEEIRQEMGYLDFFEDRKGKHLPTMKLLCSKYLNIDVDATIGKPHAIDYFQDPIPVRIIKFATLEAYHYRLLGETMFTVLENDITMPQPSAQFQVGTKVKVYIGSRVDHVAEGIIEYLGGINGECVGFGEKMINQGNAIVRIIEVIKWDARPKYLKETYMLYGLQWERDVTLGTVLNSPLPLIAIDTKRLVRMDEIDKNLWVDKTPVKQPKKLSKARKKKLKKRRERKQLMKVDKADAEAKLSNFWDF
jgi:hypothetical protein